MAGNRKAAEKIILEGIEALLPGGDNVQLYTKAFEAMSDQEFDQFINDLETGAERLSIVEAPLSPVSLSVERNLALAKKWGHEFFERIWIPESGDRPRYLSNEKYLILELPGRRQAQILIDKIAIPKSTSVTDDLTGQPAGESKGSRVSYSETQILSSLNLMNTLEELLKYRGGDVQGFRVMNDSISETGEVRLEDLGKLGTRVKSTETVSTFLTCMHLSNTLVKR